jgi:transcriptional regulator with XRE-family HTH domain
MTVTNPEDIRAQANRERGARIAHWREVRDLSQTELALTVGTQKSEISRWETGLRRPSVAAIARLADALDVDWHVLEFGYSAPGDPDQTPP